MLTLDSMLREIEADSRGKADYVTQWERFQGV